ncbi:MAG: DEAD/DEAH box helicase family protein [Eubacteriales bacterium]|nr:DEAD/DEAH box helicase family protein [Eubacteriales bacterium]
MPGAKIDLTKSTPRDIDPYDYQREAIARLDAYYAPDRNTPTKYRSGVLVMPTGSGKTFTSVSWLLDKAVGAGYQLIWLVHRQELVRQACETLVEMSPVLKNYGFDKIRIVPVSSSDSGISQAVGADIIVGCIQSLANKNGLKYLGLITKGKGRSRLAVVIDEAHHASSDSYRLVLKRLEQYNPDYMLLGMTATPTRMVEAEKRRFQQLFSISDNVKNRIGTPRGFIYEVTLKDLIKRGALANPVYRRVETQINGEVEFDFTDADRKHLERFGELSEKVKQKVADSSRRNRIIVDEYMKNREKYGKTVIFAVNQLHCRTLQQAFAGAGISNDRCRYAISDEKKQADINIAAFKNDEFPILINVRMLTEGFDSPNIQTCFLTRFTQSASLKMQMAGRALRGVKSKGTKFAYIVDFHDMWEGIETDWGGIIEGERFVTCPQCGSRRNADEDIVCPFCGADIKPVKTPAEPAERVHIPPEVYIRIYGAMRDNLMHNTHNDVVPVGWYTIPDDEGMERVILVYDHQLYGYKRLERDIETKGRPDQTAAFYIGSPSYFSDETLTEQTWPPDETDLTLFIEYAKAAGQIPLFYTFEQRDALDPYQIAGELGTQDFGGNFLEQSRKANAWLRAKHADNPILRDLYRNPDDFVRTVNGIISDNKEEKAKIEYYDNRDPYIIEPGVYDLNLLRDEVISDIRAAGVKDSNGQPLFANAVRPDLVWSGRIMKSYFGICCKRGTPDDIRYFIRINKIMSSPQAAYTAR